MRKISSEKAWENALTSRTARWPDRQPEKFSGLTCPIEYTPKFKISADDAVFCIGSCFARNIEEHLIYRGFNVLSRRIVCPIEEWSARPTGIVNKYTTHSMLNEIEWAINRPNIDENFFAQTKDKWQDLQLGGPGVSSVERSIERRYYFIDDYFQRVRAANVVVITLGLVEAWHDNQLGIYLNAAPGHFTTKRNPSRYTFEATTVQQNVEALQRMLAAIKSINNQAKFLITVSPVPLTVTFSGRDVLSANAFSKAVLRCAADAVVAGSDDIDYFPSYEMIAHAPRTKTFKPDLRHVTDSAVAEVVSAFLAAHQIDIDAPGFNEMQYLSANPDVETLVRAGTIDSGFHHWVASGRQEGRPLAPPKGVTRRQIVAARAQGSAI